MASPGLAELHLHLYGCLRPDAVLARIEGREIDWSRYRASMAAAYGVAPPVEEIVARHQAGDTTAAADFAEMMVFGDADAGNFARFLAKFDVLISSSVFSTFTGAPGEVDALLAEIRTATDHIRNDHAATGVHYAETRFLAGAGFAAEAVRAMFQTLADTAAATTGTGTVERVAPSLPRRDPWRDWELVKEVALGPTGEAVTGIDFCHVEEGHPPKDKAEFFAAVHQFNDEHPGRALAVLYHVGESFTDKSLESSVRWVQQAAELGAHRLGHAIALGIDPDCYGDHERTESVAERIDQIAYDLDHAEGLARHGVAVDRAALDAERRRLVAQPSDATVSHRYDEARRDEVRRRQDYAMDRVRDAGAVIEVCPTSNRRIGGITDPDHHPVHRFLDAGLRVVVASDDPGIFGVTLDDELDWVASAAGLDADQRADLAHAVWQHRSEALVRSAVT